MTHIFVSWIIIKCYK